MTNTATLIESGFDHPWVSAPGMGGAGRGVWPVSWIACPQADRRPLVVAYRRRFHWPGGATVIHVSADERYDLWLDGQRIGRGPQRGTRRMWWYESYRLDLAPGEHTLVARVWSLGGSAPYVQISLRHGFICGAGSVAGRAEEIDQSFLGTGVAAWEWRALVEPEPVGRHLYGTGRRERWLGRELDWDWTRGDGGTWLPVELGPQGRSEKAVAVLPLNEHGLQPATVTRRLSAPWHGCRVRHVDDAAETEKIQCQAEAHRADEAGAWQQLLDGRGVVVIPANTSRRVVVDTGDYFTGYPWMTLRGGNGAEVRVSWAEVLVDGPDPKTARKGHRDEVAGRWFLSRHLADPDSFVADGREQRFETLWWRAGRYLQIEVATAQEPVTLTGFGLEETRGGLEDNGAFAADDDRWPALLRCCRRSLQVNAHETYMDSPYYEQQQWVGDARVQALCGYVMDLTTGLQRGAIATVATSRTPAGWVSAFYPVQQELCIPSFSLAWVNMLLDLARWRGESAFVDAQAPVARGVLDWFWRNRDGSGLVGVLPGWLYTDWTDWKDGVPPGGFDGPLTTLNAFLLFTMEAMGEMEHWLGEPELSARWSRRADELSAALVRHCWDANRGRFVDAPGRTEASEHAQALAALSARLRDRLGTALAKALGETGREAKCSPFFHHYFFEACAAVGREDLLHERLTPWFELPRRGLTATPEGWDPTRSDSHAWSAHPLYHARATIAGIRPAGMGFERVMVQPRPGPLRSIQAQMPHMRGTIELTLRAHGKIWTGMVTLPPSLQGEYVGPDGRRQPLNAGTNRIG